MPNQEPRVGTPKEREAFKKCIAGYIGWYDWETQKYNNRSSWTQRVTVAFGFLATIIAALPLPDYYSPWIKWGVVVFTSTVTIASGLHWAWSQLASLREKGRVEFTLLEQEMEMNLTHLKLTEEGLLKLKLKVFRDIAALERQYGVVPKSATDRQ